VHVQVDLICSIIDCLTSGDLSVPYNAVKCLQQFQCTKILSFLPVSSKLLSILEMSAELRTRLYDVMLFICIIDLKKKLKIIKYPI